MGTCTRNTSYLWNVKKCIMRRLCADQRWQTVSPIRYFPGQPSHHQCCYFIGFSQMPGDSTRKQHIASKSLDFQRNRNVGVTQSQQQKSTWNWLTCLNSANATCVSTLLVVEPDSLQHFFATHVEISVPCFSCCSTPWLCHEHFFL